MPKRLRVSFATTQSNFHNRFNDFGKVSQFFSERVPLLEKRLLAALGIARRSDGLFPPVVKVFRPAAAVIAAGRKESEVVREAIGQYLGQTDPSSVKGALENLQERVANVERKLSSFGRLAG